MKRPHPPDPTRPRWRRSAAAGLAVLLLAVFGVACGNDEPTASPRLAEVDPAGFAARVDDAATNVINVHVPYEGEIEGTDGFILYDKIVGHPGLPTDRAAPILLYCRSGNMSEQAGNALIAAGYTNVTHLAGGMNAWTADGRTLLTKPGP